MTKSGVIAVRKVNGVLNPADVLTKPMSFSEMLGKFGRVHLYSDFGIHSQVEVMSTLRDTSWVLFSLLFCLPRPLSASSFSLISHRLMVAEISAKVRKFYVTHISIQEQFHLLNAGDGPRDHGPGTEYVGERAGGGCRTSSEHPEARGRFVRRLPTGFGSSARVRIVGRSTISSWGHFEL